MAGGHLRKLFEGEGSLQRRRRRGRSKLGASEDDSATDENMHQRLEEAQRNKGRNVETSREVQRARFTAVQQLERRARDKSMSRKRNADGERESAGRSI